MSRRSAKKRGAARNQSTNKSAGTVTNAPQQSAQDAFSNPAAKIGWGTESMAESAEYPLIRETLNYMRLLSLYRSSGILRRIVNKPVEDACAHWLKIDSQLTPDQIDALERLQKQTELKKHVEAGMKWGRLFGGAAGLIMIDGQGDMLDQPLDLDTVEPDSFKGIYVVDRWSGIYPELKTVDDISNPAFGLPEFYEVRVSEDGSSDMKVHNSRIVRFPGEELPYWETLVEQYWGASIIETCLDELKQYDNTRWNIANLIFQANVWIEKTDDLQQMLSMSPRAAQNNLFETIHAQQTLMSSFNTRVIGKDDDLTNRQYTFSGLDDVFEIFMFALSSVTSIPVAILFGRSPAGMDATGESDLENYYTLIEGMQENRIRPVMEQLLPIMCMSEFGAVPDDLNVRFNPVRTPTEPEIADLVQKKASTVNELFQSGLLPQKIALKELQSMSESTGAFSNITDDDIKQADSTPDIGDFPPASQSQDSFAQDFEENDHPRNKGRFIEKNDSEAKAEPENAKSSKEPIDNSIKTQYSKILLNCRASDGVIIKRIYPHALKRAIGRKVSPDQIKRILRQPDITYPGNKPHRTVYVKDRIRVIVDYTDGTLISVVKENDDYES